MVEPSFLESLQVIVYPERAIRNIFYHLRNNYANKQLLIQIPWGLLSFRTGSEFIFKCSGTELTLCLQNLPSDIASSLRTSSSRIFLLSLKDNALKEQVHDQYARGEFYFKYSAYDEYTACFMIKFKNFSNVKPHK